MPTVTEADRKAAADLQLADGNQTWRAECTRKGSSDEGPTVQAFAAHRESAMRLALEAAAKVAEEYEYLQGSYDISCLRTKEWVADAIRSISIDEIKG